MLYRQKVLLALLQASGGSLSRTDLEKLIFLYCKYVAVNHYDFFPYRFGAFSYATYYDKEKLTKARLLKDVPDFEVIAERPFLPELELRDRNALIQFVRANRGLTGRELVRKTYLEFPEYVARSEIARDVLSAEEFQVVSIAWHEETTPTLFTIGYEGISLDEYLYRLISRNVLMLVDVRKNPFSRKPGFSQKQLQSSVERSGIEYLHLPELGIASHLRRSLDSKEDYADLFEHYTREILPKRGSELNELKELIQKRKRVAITCFEADPQMCHRGQIVTFLETAGLGVPVVHL